MPRSWLVVLLLFLVPPLAVQGQHLIEGTVVDARSGEPLPSATIQVEGTYRGTITNTDGAFSLLVPDLPATLLVRFIGYETARVPVAAPLPEHLDVRLEPVAYEMPEIVVSGEDPAVRIMREVIERKKEWRAALETYRVEAYNRFTLSNDTGIVSIIETVTEAFWDHEQGMKETLLARRETSNLNIEESFPAAFFVTNLYDDDVEVGGFTLMGVTHPKALSHYDFTLAGTRYLDDRLVYDIDARPRNRLTSAFVGRVSVLDEAYALLEVELRPGEAFRFPPPVDRYAVTYRQQFSNFGGAFWLPVDFRSEMESAIRFGALLAFPTFRISQVSRFSGYEVNVALPDSLFERDDYLAVDSAAVAAGALLKEEGVAVPLSRTERVAYAEIDSTMGLEEAFAPTGPLARFVDLEFDDESASASGEGGSRFDLPFDLKPMLWYNRVDELHAGLNATAEVGGMLTLTGGGGYSTGLDGAEAWSYQARARVEAGRPWRRLLFVEGGYVARTALRYDTDLYNRFINGLAVLLGEEDYFDYLRTEGWNAVAGFTFNQPDFTLSVGYRDEDHRSLPRTTSYDLLGNQDPLRDNPPVREGRLKAVTGRLVIGESFDPLSIFGRNLLQLSVEHGLNDDFNYTRFDLLGDARLNTFFQRRLLPNVLYLRLTAGTSRGNLPLQRFGTVDASLGPYRPFGSLRTLGGRPYEGEKYVGAFWEHNFRTIPFELLGLDALSRKSYNVIVFGGHGRTWISDERCVDDCYFPRSTDGFHHEVGLSLSGLLSVLRIDFGVRLDEPGFTIGLGAARIF